MKWSDAATRRERERLRENNRKNKDYYTYESWKICSMASYPRAAWERNQSDQEAKDGSCRETT